MASVFLHDVMSPHCTTVDTAIVGARQEPPEGADFGDLYVGAIGSKAVGNTWNAFENPLRLSTRDGNVGSEAVTGIAQNHDPTSALARAALSSEFPALPTYCYSRMNELAEEFIQQYEDQAELVGAHS